MFVTILNNCLLKVHDTKYKLTHDFKASQTHSHLDSSGKFITKVATSATKNGFTN